MNNDKEDFEKKISRACDFIQWLKKEHNIDATICGGCARDVYFGLTPKDVDVVIYTKIPIKKMYEPIIRRYLSKVRDEEAPNTFIHIGSMSTYNGDRVKERIEHIWKLYDLDIDVLLYRCPTKESIMDHFDFNINQFIMDGFTREVTYFGTTSLTELQEIRGDHENDREEYITNKHKNLISLAIEKGIKLPDPMVRDVCKDITGGDNDFTFEDDIETFSESELLDLAKDIKKNISLFTHTLLKQEKMFK